MSSRSIFRAAAAAGILILVAACSDDRPVISEPEVFLAPPTTVNGPVEALITFSPYGYTPDPGAPIFNLSSLPGSVEAGHALDKTITVDPNHPFAPAVAVDYGDGGGPHSISSNLTSFRLRHTYANPGTYTMKVAAQNTEGSRIETATVQVTQNLDVFIRNFEISSPIRAGWPASYSFGADGYGDGPFTVTTRYGNGSSSLSSIANGGTNERTYTWKQPGTYTFQIEVSNGTRTATLTRQITVEDTPATVEDRWMTPDLAEGDEGQLRFRVMGPGDDAYKVTVDYGDGTEDVRSAYPGGTVNLTHTWESGEWRVFVRIETADDSWSYFAWSVSVSRPNPTLEVLTFPETAYVDEEAEFTLVLHDPTVDPDYFAWVLVSTDIQIETIIEKPGEVEVGHATWTTPGEHPVFMVGGSSKNGYIVTDTFETIVTVLERPEVECDPGYYKSDGACVPAPPGTFVSGSGADQATLCVEGTYQDQAGQTECLPAPPGTFVDMAGATEATRCEVGTFQAQPGSTGCEDAPPGTFVAFEGAIEAIPCAPGSYQPQPGSVSCDPAPAGSYVPVAGAIAFQACEVGTFSATSGQAACELAMPGTYVDTEGQTEATRCDVGFYQNLKGQTSCIPAPAGSYVSVTGAGQPTQCAPGTYQAATGSTSCDLAPAGSFVSGPGATEYQTCEAGTYSANAGQATCDPAPAGSYVASAGQSQATMCEVGRYQDRKGQTSCLPAPAGSYVSVTGASQPTQCAPGTYQAATGSASCDPAPAGSFASGPGAVEYQACQAGTYSATEGQAACDPSPAGSYVATEGQTQATRCEIGRYQDLTGQTSCIPAPAGSYVDVTGAQQPTACAAGTFQPNEGSYSCIKAEPGHYVSGPGAADDTACALGTYQPEAGQTSCILAPIGSYVDVTGARQATSCPTATTTTAEGSTSASDCVSVGEITVRRIDDAVRDGGLVPADSGKGGQKALDNWLKDVKRSVDFLSGPQHQAGCVGVRNAYAKADGKGSPKDAVKGSALGRTGEDLQWVLSENQCRGR